MESASHTLDQRRFSVDGGMDPNFLNGITVLHVEDKELHSFTAKKAVEGNQWIYTYVNSGEAAVELYQKGKVFDVIFMDLNLGSGMNGYQTAEKIRDIRPKQLIYSSSSEESSSIIEGYFKAHLGKVGGKVSLYQAISKDLIELRITFLS